MGQFSFTVLLSDQFPEATPRLFGESRFSHPMMDQNGNIVGVQELSHWSPSNSDLGRVVQTVVTQFVASPPVLRGAAAAANAQAQPAPPQMQRQYQPQPAQKGQQQRPSGYQPVQPLPAAATQPAPPTYQQHVKRTQSVLNMETIKISIPQKVPQIEQLSRERIEEMVSEDKLIEEFAYSVAQGIREMREQQQNEVLRLAKANLTQKEFLLREDKEIQALRSEIDALSLRYNDVKGRQDKELQKFSKPKLNQLLNQEIAASDEKTNELRDKFDEGDLPPIGFVKKYVKERTHYHLLQIKKEKLNIW